MSWLPGEKKGWDGGFKKYIGTRPFFSFHTAHFFCQAYEVEKDGRVTVYF